MITRVKVSNFKSFAELDVELRPLNIVVGSNAAGKSNFLEIFRFLRDIAEEDLENAVSLQGGMEYLTNLQIGSQRPVSLEIDLRTSGLKKFTYTLELLSKPGSPGFEIVSESIAPNPTIYPARALLVAFIDFGIFDLDPKLAKEAVPISGRAHLEPDGGNLALVLRNLLQDSEKSPVFVRLLRDTLPFIKDLSIESSLDKSLQISARENFSDRPLPATFLSDGTIHLTALILALYFDEAEVIVVEEPERNIHPHLIAKVVRMLTDASRNKQIIITTHNPELVKHADLADLLLVTRDEQGFSHVTRPAESAELKVFLENDLGVDELYVQNLLGAGHGV